MRDIVGGATSGCKRGAYKRAFKTDDYSGVIEHCRVVIKNICSCLKNKSKLTYNSD